MADFQNVLGNDDESKEINWPIDLIQEIDLLDLKQYTC